MIQFPLIFFFDTNVTFYLQVPVDKFQFLTRIHYEAPSDGVWGEHEMDYILIIKANVNLDVNPNECRDVKYVSATALKEMFKDECKCFFRFFFSFSTVTFLTNSFSHHIYPLVQINL